MIEMKTLPFEDHVESRNINKDAITEQKSLLTVMQLPPMHHQHIPASLDPSDNKQFSD